MNETSLTDVLEDAGLSPYQAEAYVTVLELGSASATDIAEESEVPDPRIYDVLRDLEKMGYIETYEQDSLQARAFSPDKVLADLRSRAEKFEAAADEIENRWEAPTMESHTVSFVKRLETVLDKTESKIREATNQIQVALSYSQFERLKPALRTAHENGAIISIALYGDGETDESDLAAETFQGLADEVRFRSMPMPLVALIDRKVTCFAPHEFSTNRYGIIIEDRTHAYVFHWFFMSGLWVSTDLVYKNEDTDRIFVNIRSCIREVKPLLEAGKTVTATVHGTTVDGESSVTLEGVIREVHYPSGEKLGPDIPFEYLGGQATLVLDTGEEVVEVGGWGAIIEDVEANRIVIEDVSD